MQRSGSKGKLEKIDHWWYCKSCDTMHHEPYQMPESPDLYRHPEGKEKFPEISKVFRPDVAKLSKLNIELKNFFRLWEPERVGKQPIHTKYFVIPTWICYSCQHLIQLDRMSLPLYEKRSLDEIQKIQPDHCGNPMKLLINARDSRDPIFEAFPESPVMRHEIKVILDHINENNVEMAGYFALKRVLQILSSDVEFLEMKNLLIPINQLLQTSPTDITAKFVSSWGFNSLIMILRAYIDDHSFYTMINKLDIPLQHPSREFYATIMHWIQYQRGSAKFGSQDQFEVKFDQIINDIVLFLSNAGLENEIHWIREIAWKVKFMNKNYLQISNNIQQIMEQASQELLKELTE